MAEPKPQDIIIAIHLKVEYSGASSPNLILPYLLKAMATNSTTPAKVKIRVPEPKVLMAKDFTEFATL